MHTLIFATQNRFKRDEVQAMLGNDIHVLSLSDLYYEGELPETHETLEENALEKAQFISNKFSMDCFSEDTGLEIDALNGEPGVYSARYAGNGKSATDNIERVLRKMSGEKNRKAKFRTIVCLILKDQIHYFEGIVNGIISEDITGNSGFGYDPVFIPEGSNKTFATMSKEEKNRTSHRRIAVERMKEFLKTHNHSDSHPGP
ncbi:MAG: RdgB/HAM1 family non-canonical purine NTP pyrophosphatase [Chitinophagales bacterium]